MMSCLSGYEWSDKREAGRESREGGRAGRGDKELGR